LNNTIKSILKGVLLPLLFLSFLLGCEKENTDIGVGLRPDGGNINSLEETIDSILCRTISEDSLRTDSLNTNILGAMNDPAFGTSRASLIMQPLLSEFGLDFSGSTLDSVTLTLKFDRSQILGGVENLTTYGNLETPINLDVYKLNEDLSGETRYYSDFRPELGDKIGTYSGPINFFDSTWQVINGDSSFVSPQLRFRLDNAFGEEFISQPSSVFSGQDEFKAYLKGLVLVPNADGLAPGEGAIFGIDLFSSRTGLTFFYDDEVLEVSVGTESERINYYEIVDHVAEIEQQKATTLDYDKGFVQALGGTKLKIEIPKLNNFIERGERVVINEARLSVNIDATSVTEDYRAPARMLLLQPNKENGTNDFIIDFIDDSRPPATWRGFTNYGGRFDAVDNQYSFRFNRFLQQLIDDYVATGVNNFRGFYLTIPSDFPITPSRAVLNTQEGEDGIDVSITYTKLN
jgi:hypothetical protein